jgi:hypothetical protein
MSVRAARQGDMQRANATGRPHIVSETPPPPKMMVVFSPRKRLTEKRVGLARAGPPNIRGGRTRQLPTPRPSGGVAASPAARIASTMC